MYSNWRSVVLTLVFAVSGMFLETASLRADIMVGAPGNAGDCAPFGCSDISVYQQVFDSSLFSGPTTIAGLGFQVFDDPLSPLPDTIFPAQYHILFSTVSIPVDGLDSNLENNINPSAVQDFFIGSIADPVNGQFTVVTTQPNYYNYDPLAGNLLMQIQTDADYNDPTLSMYALVNSSSGKLFSSASDNPANPGVVGCPDGSTSNPCVNSDYGLVVDFLTPADLNPVPEPGALSLLITILGLIGAAACLRVCRHRLKSLP